jgi:hypothetical protein
MLPAVYAKSYAELSSWLWFNDDWNWTGTPIVMYLQNSGKQATKAAVAEGAFWEALAKANKGKSLRYVKTFNFDDYDYIPTSIHRTPELLTSAEMARTEGTVETEFPI